MAMIQKKDLHKALQRRLLKSWNKADSLTIALWPFSILYRGLFFLKKTSYQIGLAKSYRAPVPVVVVGNITVGGTGKTPLVVYLIELLREYGYRPGVISRGYAGESSSYPVSVDGDTAVAICGDEPAMIVQRTNVPMVIGPNRRDDIELLLQNFDINVVISDDGLQHFELQRDIDICLQDATSQQENTHLLPAGPYREPKSKLDHFDLLVHHVSAGSLTDKPYSMNLLPQTVKALSSSNTNSFDASNGVHAVAGIGNPQRFFDTCRQLGWNISEHAFEDHYAFVASDLEFSDDLPIVMTEKDAVKCQEFNNNCLWYLPVDVNISKEFSRRFKVLLESIHQPVNKT
ncbi:MAG: tetraacyldisaccharide 4'-kinase [Arenicella sp.]|jgi:tetraacyldisaccharide 4'-kinase